MCPHLLSAVQFDALETTRRPRSILKEADHGRNLPLVICAYEVEGGGISAAI
jgi:hypothetical protein